MGAGTLNAGLSSHDCLGKVSKARSPLKMAWLPFGSKVDTKSQENTRLFATCHAGTRKVLETAQKSNELLVFLLPTSGRIVYPQLYVASKRLFKALCASNGRIRIEPRRYEAGFRSSQTRSICPKTRVADDHRYHD